ncbi:serine hydrolase domain-containing protein [Lihuaxuella thermophila]|uniref:CubicO group peptidase, beta-lactamase class C family n=1 Tax=Lihuaxuella thermophila TaxID=1173111 RepID=A0A1H8H5K6_9BACL|nr:serine hydrolase domain-containing protein [Lihuaxuella thermophila]SEN51516.1 CubicO group peptidase, beta-lactamase class C family [Lihuaxuella thermophila]
MQQQRCRRFMLALVLVLLLTPFQVRANGTSLSTGLSIEQKETKELHPSSTRPSSWDHPLPSSPVLHPGTPASAGMDREPLKAIDPFMQESIENNVMPGAVVLIARRGAIVKHQAYGYAARYQDDRFTPMDKPIPMSEDTIFDLASISKIFTSTAAMKLYEQGKFRLDDPVARYIPEFAQNGKEKVTIRQLMTHTSGFRPGIPLWQMGKNREERLQIVFAYPLDHPPGTTYVYSDLNMITLGALVERLSGQRLDVFIRENITEPLHMKDTMYNPPASLKERIAATEYQPWTGRGLVWGQVHDENAAALDGVAGHAGLFSTARDLVTFAHMILMKGKYGNTRILQPETVEWMEENQNQAFPGDDHGLGWELNQGWFMDALASPHAMGHTGYTGTSIVINRDQAAIAITLTNRVHPTRQTVSTNPVRRQVARLTADAIPVPIPGHSPAWFSGYGDHLDRTLTAELPDSSGPETRTLAFATWYRIEPGADFGIIEASIDGVNWSTIGSSYTGSSDGWTRHVIAIPKGMKYLRFRYHTDATVNGRGWYLKDPTVTGENGQPLSLTWSGNGWEMRR